MELVLGAAALGNNYGVFGNLGNLTQSDQARGFLSAARANGFDAIDTAPAYGSSEELVGQSDWTGSIHTKLQEDVSPVSSLNNSLQRLKKVKVDVLYLFREPDNWVRYSNRKICSIAAGLLWGAQSIGASVYHPLELERFLEIDEIGVIQIPVNPLARRFERSLQELSGSRPKIYARSVLLQGLLIGEKTPNHLGFLRPFVNEFKKLARDLDRSPGSLAIGYAKSLPNIDGLIVGAQSAQELAQISKIFNATVLSPYELALVRELPEPPQVMTDPRNWGKQSKRSYKRV